MLVGRDRVKKAEPSGQLVELRLQLRMLRLMRRVERARQLRRQLRAQRRLVLGRAAHLRIVLCARECQRALGELVEALLEAIDPRLAVGLEPGTHRIESALNLFRLRIHELLRLLPLPPLNGLLHTSAQPFGSLSRRPVVQPSMHRLRTACIRSERGGAGLASLTLGVSGRVDLLHELERPCFMVDQLRELRAARACHERRGAL